MVAVLRKNRVSKRKKNSDCTKERRLDEAGWQEWLKSLERRGAFAGFCRGEREETKEKNEAQGQIFVLRVWSRFPRRFFFFFS